MLTRFDPFFGPSLQNAFEDAFRLQRNLLRQTAEPAAERPVAPPVDIWEDDQEVRLSVELPGVKPEEVEVEMNKNVLTLKGRREAERTESEKGRFRTERWFGAFERVFTLPDSVDGEHIEAALEHGVLTLRLPKKAEVQPRKIPVLGQAERGHLQAA